MSSKLSKPQLLELLEKKEREIEARASELKQSETKVAQLRATLETFSAKITQTNLVVEEHQSLVLRHAEVEKQLARERAARIKLQKAAHASKAPSTSSPIAETASCANLSTAAGSDTARDREDLSKRLQEERGRREAAERQLEEYKRQGRDLIQPGQPPQAAPAQSGGASDAEEIIRLKEALRVAENELKGARAASRDLSLRQNTMQEEKKKLVQELSNLQESKRQALRRISELESAALKDTRAPQSLVRDPSQEDQLREMRRKLSEAEAARQRAETEAATAKHETEKTRRQMLAPRQDSCPPSSFSLPSAAQATAGVVGAAVSRGREGGGDHFTRFESQLKEQKEQMAIMQSEIKWLRKKVEPAGDNEPARDEIMMMGMETNSDSLAATRSGGESPAPNRDEWTGQGEGEGEGEEPAALRRGFKRCRDREEESQTQLDGKVGTAAGSSSPRKEKSKKQQPQQQQPEDSITEILYPITHGHARRAAVVLGGEASTRQQATTSGFSAASTPTLLTVRAAARKLIELCEKGCSTWEEVSSELVSALSDCARNEGAMDLPLSVLGGGGGGKRGEGGESGGGWTGWCSSEAKRRGVIKALVSCILILDDTLDKAQQPNRPLLPLILNQISSRVDRDGPSRMTCSEKCALLSAAGLLCKESGCLAEYRTLLLDLLGQPPELGWSPDGNPRVMQLGRDQYLMLASLLNQWSGSIVSQEEDVIGCALQFILSRVSFLQPGEHTREPETVDKVNCDEQKERHIESLIGLYSWICGDDCSLEGGGLKTALDQTSRIVRLMAKGLKIELEVLGLLESWAQAVVVKEIDKA